MGNPTVLDGLAASGAAVAQGLGSGFSVECLLGAASGRLA